MNFFKKILIPKMQIFFFLGGGRLIHVQGNTLFYNLVLSYELVKKIFFFVETQTLSQ